MTVALLNASGCLDALAAPDVARSLDAFVTKTVTPLPREGNRPPRFAETELGMLNSIGLQNPGIDVFVRDQLPALEALDMPIWVSVGGFRADDFAHVCAVLDGCAAVTTLELNLSCPNVDEAPESAAELVESARAVTSKPLYAKLSPATWDIGENARAVAAAGADGLSLVNTIRGLALDDATLRPRLGAGLGGYSGPGLAPVALACVYACATAVDIPIVGMGGVRTGRDALALDRCRRECGRTRNDPVLGPRFAGPSAPGARRRSRGPTVRVPGRDSGHRVARRRIGRSVGRIDNAKRPANQAKRSRLTLGAMLVDSGGSWSRRRCTLRRPPARSTRGWRRCKGPTTCESGERS